MKRLLLAGIAASFLMAGLAGAQDRDRYQDRYQDRDRDRDRARDNRDYDWYHQDRDDRWKGDRWRSRLFWQVREDLEHVQTATFPIGRDQYRLQRTKQELNEMQDKMTRGVYDQRELDEVIGAMQRVVADNRMAPRDREVLTEDLRRLNEYREHHEGWGR